MVTNVDNEMKIDFKAEAGDPNWLPVDDYIVKPIDPNNFLAKNKENDWSLVFKKNNRLKRIDKNIFSLLYISVEKNYDVIIILGNAVTHNGKPGDILLTRLIKGIELFKSKNSK